MPATLSQLVRNRVRIDLDVGDGVTLFIEYRPAAITPRLLHEMSALDGRQMSELSAEERTAALDAITRYLAAVVLDWDLLDADGKKIPPTHEGLQDVDYEAQTFLVERIQEHMQLGEANGASKSGPSPSASSRKGGRATSRQ